MPGRELLLAEKRQDDNNLNEEDLKCFLCWGELIR